jgi:hypothetical protein
MDVVKLHLGLAGCLGGGAAAASIVCCRRGRGVSFAFEVDGLITENG